MGVFAIPVGQLVLLLDKPSSQSGSSLIAHSEDAQLVTTPTLLLPRQIAKASRLLVDMVLAQQAIYAM